MLGDRRAERAVMESSQENRCKLLISNGSKMGIFIILLCPPGWLASGFPLEFTQYLIRGGNGDEGQGGWNGWLPRKSFYLIENSTGAPVKKQTCFTLVFASPACDY
jgi:hypothetical protein